MKSNFSKFFLVLLVGLFCPTRSALPAAQENASVLTAKREAEAKGFTFIASHDEIVGKAKKEGKVRVLSAHQSRPNRRIAKAFKQKYPFLDIDIEEIRGTDSAQRFLLELQAGTVTDWDVFRVSTDFYDDLADHAKKIDFLRMAEHGVLRIPPKMIDSRRGNLINVGNTIATIAYNRNLISEDQVPNTWEDFLKPKFKGRKFLVDIRPLNFTPFAAALGEEWLVNYARKLKEQEPIWVRGHTRALTAMVGGEYALHQLTNYNSCMRAVRRDPRKVLVCKVIEPIPVRESATQAIVDTAPHPHSAILFLEFLASPEVQRILDESGPFMSSIYAPDSELEKLTRGKKLVVLDNFKHAERWIEMTVEAFGFPQQDKPKK